MPPPRALVNVPLKAPPAPESRIEIIEPTLGFDKSQPAVDLKPGQTPNSENWVVEDGFLTPRSGLSIFGPSNTSLGGVGLMVFEHQDVNGQRFPVLASPRTVVAFLSDSWSTLSYVIRGTGQAADAVSGLTTDSYQATSVYEPVLDEHILIFSNGKNIPKVWRPSATTYSDLSDFISVESVGKVPYAIDDRLCFFNCASSETTFATRVRWSERGLTSQFSTQGAGFQDLMDMRGVGQGVATREFDAVLFSSEEVWLQRPRRDIFAFDFIALNRSLGCPFPKTITRTPLGIIFLSRDLEPYIVRGNQVEPIGPAIHQHLRSQIRNPEFAFSLYNSKRQRYEFYFDTTMESERPAHGLWLDIDRGAWMPITTHNLEFGAGAEVGADLGSDIIWDNVGDDWDDINTTWDNMVESATRDKNVMLLSSNGTAYRFRDEQGNDDGSQITATWDSHIMSGQDRTRKQQVYEVWTRVEQNSASSFSLFVRGDDNEAFAGLSIDVPIGETKVFSPVFTVGDSPQVRVSVDNGTRPRIANFSVKLRDAEQF